MNNYSQNPIVGQALSIGHSQEDDPASDPYLAKRSDLVFLVGPENLQELIIVELKAPNIPLLGSHLEQLKGYVRRAKKWLKDNLEPVRILDILLMSVFELRL